MENMKKYIGKCYKTVDCDYLKEMILVTDVDEENQGIRAVEINESHSGNASVSVGELIPFDEFLDIVDNEVDRRDFREVYARVRLSAEETMNIAFRSAAKSKEDCERE